MCQGGGAINQYLSGIRDGDICRCAAQKALNRNSSRITTDFNTKRNKKISRRCSRPRAGFYGFTSGRNRSEVHRNRSSSHGNAYTLCGLSRRSLKERTLETENTTDYGFTSTRGDSRNHVEYASDYWYSSSSCSISSIFRPNISYYSIENTSLAASFAGAKNSVSLECTFTGRATETSFVYQ